MHHFILATSDSWISSGSSHVDGESHRDQNFGQDEILEIKKEFYNKSFDYATRALVSFKGTDFTNMSQSIVKGDISSNAKYYLRLYESEGNQDLSIDYILAAYALSESWDEGVGKFGDKPKVTDGVSWENRTNYPGSTEVTWSNYGASSYGGALLSGSGYVNSQSFSNESPDINMDVTDIVQKWLSGSISNNGLLLQFSGSQETNNTTTGQLKFFSRNTNTIYSPKLEVRWDNHIACSGSNTGSLTQMTSSGGADNYLYMIGLRDSYKESEKVKFRVAGRERYVQKTFSTSIHRASGSFIPEDSGSYSILDVATGETIIPFSAYTSMSCDSTSNYFTQIMNTFEPDRVYKILYKIKYNDGQEQVVDNNFEFKIKR